MKMSSNKTIKMAAVLLAVIMLAAMLSMPAMADEVSTSISLSLNVQYDNGSSITKIPGAVFNVYHVGNFDQFNVNNPQYVLLDNYSSLVANINESAKSNEDWAVAAKALADYIAGDSTITFDEQLTTTDDGTVTSTLLANYGLYLVVPSSSPSEFKIGSPFLISLPNSEGGSETQAPSWNYNITASPKTALAPVASPPPTTSPTTPPTTQPTTPPTTQPTTPPTTLPDDPLPQDEVIIEDTTPLVEIIDETPLVEIPDEVPLGEAPQTGQLNWPIPVLLGVGLLLVVLGLITNERKKKNVQ